MERWIPLLEIFSNSPCPETEASLWLQQSFKPSSTSASVSTSSFLTLLSKPSNPILINSSPSSATSTPTKRVMYIETLPNMVQARILSFLVYERQRFCRIDLIKLARNMLSEGLKLDFWVKKAARQLLDALSAPDYEWVSCLNLDSEEAKVEDEFGTLPDWLKDAAKEGDLVPSWLRISLEELNVQLPFSSIEDDEDWVDIGEEEKQECVDKTRRDIEVNNVKEVVAVGPEVEKMAHRLKDGILHFEGVSKTLELANEIRQLCIESRVDSLVVLSMIEPWNADDETASILISHLLDGTEDELGWPSLVLCSVILPKLLALKDPASRVLVSAIIDYCKVHQKAAEYALLFPLILKVGGINSAVCDVITRIFRKCLHPVHVSSFCQKLLCKEVDPKQFIFLPCHRCLIAGELVLTESLFNLMHNTLSHSIHLTQDTVDQLVYEVCKSTEAYSRSLKLGNFLLCMVNKCAPFLKSHKLLLMEAVKHTNTLVTKSILSKLAGL